MLRLRLATAAVAIPLLLVLILWPPAQPAFAIFVAAIAVLGIAEYALMAFPDRRGEQILFTVLGAAVAFATAVHRNDLFAASVTVLLSGGLVYVLLARADFAEGMTDLGRGMVGALYSGFLLPQVIWLHSLPAGPQWVLFVVMTQMLGDSAGYFLGHAFGRHKLAPHVSPGKTIEGAVGIELGALLAGVVTKLILLPQLSWTEVLLLAAGQAVLGQLGDLCESVMKRAYGAKDSGRLLPGHGGVLDRIDSLVFPVAGMYYYVAVCHGAG